MNILVWQWGRFGFGPGIAVELAAGFAALPGTRAALSLSARAEIMHGPSPPACDLPVDTYASVGGYAARVLTSPMLVPWLIERVRALAPAIALCAMPGPLDLAMHLALRRLRIPFAVVVHDADRHPGDGYPLQMWLQRRLIRRAGAVVALSTHVADRLVEQGLSRDRLIMSRLPVRPYGGLPPVRQHGGRLRLLSFGRLRAYKGLDLLADALALLLPRDDLEIRVVGEGPESAELAALRRLPGVTVENRWVPDGEIAALLAWSDALVLSHREASQSGVAAQALAARRFVVSTRVGGLAEQLAGEQMALLCEPDAASLAAALRDLLTRPAGEASAPRRDQAGLLAALESVLLQEEKTGGTAPPRTPAL